MLKKKSLIHEAISIRFQGRIVRELLSVVCLICLNLSSEICAVESEDHWMDLIEHEWGIGQYNVIRVSYA